MSEIGFIGTGTIGGPMAERLIDPAHRLHVFDLNPFATRPHEAKGALRAAGVAEIAGICDTVFLSLPGPPQISEVVLGAEGLLAHAGALSTIIDLSTNSIALNREIAGIAHAKGIQYLDAPVSGGKVAAREGKLAVMVGGDQATFNAVRHLIECFGEHLFYMGPSGAGTLTKLVNNQIFLSASVLIQEGFVMGAKAGMDPTAILEVLKVSSAGSLLARAPLVLSRKFDMDVFALAIAAKDLEVALASAAAVGAEMPMTTAAAGVYQQALAAGLGTADFFATVKVLEAAAGVELPPLQKRA
ncbi:MAG: NAD(P)-dependent oxidoreductase [Gammaproteobacteria bacterium]|nr:NAD(P)-dependent oxidoreductase [Gammaproteobacteria bacterium]